MIQAIGQRFVEASEAPFVFIRHFTLALNVESSCKHLIIGKMRITR